MKLWLHFKDVLAPYKRHVRDNITGEEFMNMHEIVDVEVVLTNTPKMIMIRNMQTILQKIQQEKRLLQAKYYKGFDMFHA